MTGEPPIAVQTCTGNDVASLIPEVAALRLGVFRDWPYLYDGDAATEAAYLQAYLRSPSAAVIVARRAGRIVGASTCLPLTEASQEVRAPFLHAGLDPAAYFYFGESVLLPGCRGQGVGVAFFAAREAHARAVSACTHSSFCGVVRPDDHKARPAGFVPLDAFWRRRGYTRRADLVCRMSWRDLGEAAETAKALVFWTKDLRVPPAP